MEEFYKRLGFPFVILVYFCISWLVSSSLVTFGFVRCTLQALQMLQNQRQKCFGGIG
jgi:hypothetical protein